MPCFVAGKQHQQHQPETGQYATAATEDHGDHGQRHQRGQQQLHREPVACRPAEHTHHQQRQHGVREHDGVGLTACALHAPRRLRHRDRERERQSRQRAIPQTRRAHARGPCQPGTPRQQQGARGIVERGQVGAAAPHGKRGDGQDGQRRTQQEMQGTRRARVTTTPGIRQRQQCGHQHQHGERTQSLGHHQQGRGTES